MKPPVISPDGRRAAYLPFKELVDNMRQSLHMPYGSVFSFQPLIHKLNERVATSCCEMSARMIPQVRKLEEELTASEDGMSDEVIAAVDTMTKMLLPSLYFEGEYGFISPPFTKEFIYRTPAMEALGDADKWLVRVEEDFLNRKEYGSMQQAAAAILNKFYGQQIDLSVRENITFRQLETGRERHLRLDIRMDYVDIEYTGQGEIRPISEAEMNYLLDNFKNDEVVLEFIPADDFRFKGMGIGVFNDVTDMQIQSMIKDAVLNVRNMKGGDFISFLGQQMNDYLERQDIQFGIADVLFDRDAAGPNYSLTGSSSFREFTEAGYSSDHCHAYHEAYCRKEPVVIPDLKQAAITSPYEEALIDKGIHSLLLIPLKDSSGKVTAIVELGSVTKYAFSNFTLKKLRPIIDLLVMGNNVFLTEFNNQVERFVKSKFTAIHPSVEWKFEEIAIRQQQLHEKTGEYSELEPIIFRDVYPLYAQVDMRDSSNIRNEAIQSDLVENLEILVEMIGSLKAFTEVLILDAYLLKARKMLKDLRNGYTSGLESAALELLTREIHPYLETLFRQFPEIPRELLSDYTDRMDPELGIVNNQRKAYEKSVNRLNRLLSDFLEAEDEKMQQVLPHYFEKYKTDGIEYNIYLGQSILNDMEFSEFNLKDFRLWQLVKLAEMSRIAREAIPDLPIPIETVQMAFVYNVPLSIRFRMDEKRFDVDGSYNVRYEILKKRIDKALIKGTDERVCQVGKIAVVYMLDKDREEYMDYLGYLVEKGYIDPQIEDVELEKLPGAEGLRALRAKVI